MSANISIPRHTKASLVPWGNTFVNALEANPAAYNIDPLDVAQLRSLYDIFKADWDEFGVEDRKQNNAAAYTKAGRAQLDQSYDNFLGLASQYAVIIQADNSISIALKEAAGIVPHNFDREPVPMPAGQPLQTPHPQAHDAGPPGIKFPISRKWAVGARPPPPWMLGCAARGCAPRVATCGCRGERVKGVMCGLWILSSRHLVAPGLLSGVAGLLCSKSP